ncbi:MULTISPECIES: hypothetical protein [unclassified Pseudoalteromonas]|uniref:hypothetical protein n=1 Tax=unclassified Pseudoalteromonas TaxID=194690 RepID=UPI0005AA80EB|nr:MULTISPECIES: hypothetical protein [unclassified Pseudoalteromonas]
MSQKDAEKNLNNLKEWIALVKENDWEKFKECGYCVYQGVLSKGKVSKAADVGLKSLKTDNPAVITVFDEFAIEAKTVFPDVFQLTLSNKEKYQIEINSWAKVGKKFPIDEFGNLDYKRLAVLCGIPTRALTSASITPCLKKDVLRIGTEVSKGQSIEHMMEKKLTVTSSELNRYRKDLAIAQEKIDGLQEQILKLQKENRQLKNKSDEQEESLTYMLESGRRFSL